MVNPIWIKKKYFFFTSGLVYKQDIYLYYTKNTYCI